MKELKFFPVDEINLPPLFCIVDIRSEFSLTDIKYLCKLFNCRCLVFYDEIVDEYGNKEGYVYEISNN